MSLTEVVVQGTLNPDGSLHLDEKPSLAPGRVTVVLRQESEPVPPKEDWWHFMQTAKKKMEEAGCHVMDEKEMQAHLEWLCAGDRIDDLLQDVDEQRQEPEPAVMLLYCDSVILMYYFDHIGPFNVRATTRLAALAAAGDRIAVSDLVRLEYRVKPLKTGDTTKLALFDAFCSRSDVQVVPITTAVFDRATLIRATHNFKLADALHLAAAVAGGCDRLLTNDSRLAGCGAIPVEVLP